MGKDERHHENDKLNEMAKKDKRVKNLTPNAKGSPEAMNFHEKGLKTRLENKAKREAMKLAVDAFAVSKLESSEDISSLDTMRIIRNMAIAEGDLEKALDISKVLAEYEAPKKSRVEEITTEVDFNDYQEADVQAYLDDKITLEELRSKR